VDKIINRLDSVHQKVLAIVLPVDPDRFQQRPTENEWSVAEILDHLHLVEERVIKELEKALAGKPQKAGLLGRIIPTSIVASRLVRVSAPKAVVPTRHPEKQAAIENFESTRERLKQLCAREGQQRLRQIVMNHPFLGKRYVTAAVSFVSYHEIRHYKQIREVLRKR